MGHITPLTCMRQIWRPLGAAKEEASLSLVMAGRSLTHCGGHEASQVQLAGGRWRGHTHIYTHNTQTTEPSVWRLSSAYFIFWDICIPSWHFCISFVDDIFVTIYQGRKYIIMVSFLPNSSATLSSYRSSFILFLNFFSCRLLLRASEQGGKEGQLPPLEISYIPVHTRLQVITELIFFKTSGGRLVLQLFGNCVCHCLAVHRRKYGIKHRA